MTFLPAVVPYLIAGALVAGLASGAGAAWWVQGNRLEAAKLAHERLVASVQLARQQAENDAARAQIVADALTTDLAQSYKFRRIERVEVVKEVTRVTSSDRQCLSPVAVSVLRRAESGGNREGEDKSESSGAGGRPPADASGPAASERAVAIWMDRVRDQYVDVRDRHRTLSSIVAALPCVKIVE